VPPGYNIIDIKQSKLKIDIPKYPCFINVFLIVKNNKSIFIASII